jgi:hypothetical protein
LSNFFEIFQILRGVPPIPLIWASSKLYHIQNVVLIVSQFSPINMKNEKTRDHLNAIDKQLNKRRHSIMQFLLQALDPM